MDISRIKNGEGSASPEKVLNLLQSPAFSFWHTFSSENYIHYRDDTEEQERRKESIGILHEKKYVTKFAFYGYTYEKLTQLCIWKIL